MTRARAEKPSQGGCEQLLIDEQQGFFVLCLYVTGMSPRSLQAIANIREICEEFLPGRHRLFIVDIYQQPTAAREENLLAAPTLIKSKPRPPRRLIGNLSDRPRVLRALGVGQNGGSP